MGAGVRNAGGVGRRTVTPGRDRRRAPRHDVDGTDCNLLGSRSPETIVDPSNPTRAIDDPSVDQTTPIYVRRQSMVTAELGYTLCTSCWHGRSLAFRLTIKNLRPDQSVVYHG